MNKRGVLQYSEDYILFESEHFISIVNAKQKRAHIIVRSKRELPADAISNNLEYFSEENKREFWHLVQKVVADARVPSYLCHHFGKWRSADHFHVHIVCNKNDFGNYVERKTQISSESVVKMINDKEKYLIRRHINEFKMPEIKEIREKYINMTVGDEEIAPSEWGGYRVELDSTYPLIKFIPKSPIKYSKDPREIQKELEYYRNDCFSKMFTLADHYKFEGVFLFSNS